MQLDVPHKVVLGHILVATRKILGHFHVNVLGHLTLVILLHHRVVKARYQIVYICAHVDSPTRSKEPITELGEHIRAMQHVVGIRIN